MNRSLILRRRKMIRYLSQGIQPNVVMKELADEFSVSENTVWHDWYRRDKWLPVILNIDDANAKKLYGDLFAMVNEAKDALWSIYHKTDNPFAKIKALDRAVSIAETQMKLLNSLVTMPDIENVEDYSKIKFQSLDFLKTLVDIEPSNC